MSFIHYCCCFSSIFPFFLPLPVLSSLSLCLYSVSYLSFHSSSSSCLTTSPSIIFPYLFFIPVFNSSSPAYNIFSHLLPLPLFPSLSCCFLLFFKMSEMKARGLQRRIPEARWQITSFQMLMTQRVVKKMVMRWMMKTTTKKTMMVTPPQRLARAPPARSLMACPPFLSQLWPPPNLFLTSLTIQRPTSWETPAGRLCLAISPPCQVSRSHHRLRLPTWPGGSTVSQSTREASSGRRVAGCWFHPPPPPPWMKTFPSPPQISPPPHHDFPHPVWTTLAAHPPFPHPPHPQPAVTSPHVVTSHPAQDTCHPGGTFLLCVTSPLRETWEQQGDTGETFHQEGDTCHCFLPCLGPRHHREEITSETFHHEAATGG